MIAASTASFSVMGAPFRDTAESRVLRVLHGRVEQLPRDLDVHLADRLTGDAELLADVLLGSSSVVDVEEDLALALVELAGESQDHELLLVAYERLLGITELVEVRPFWPDIIEGHQADVVGRVRRRRLRAASLGRRLERRSRLALSDGDAQ